MPHPMSPPDTVVTDPVVTGPASPARRPPTASDAVGRAASVTVLAIAGLLAPRTAPAQVPTPVSKPSLQASSTPQQPSRIAITTS